MKCGGCTLCCKLLSIPWMNSPAGELCIQCDQNKGCLIYNTAPKKCLEYKCAYAQMNKVSINLRPDNCHVIFEKIPNSNIFIGLADPAFSLHDNAKSQIRAFVQQGFSVSLSVLGQGAPMIFPIAGKSAEEIFKEVQLFLVNRGL